jgi:hypothetical protein
MAEIYQLPDGNGGSGVGNIPFSIPIGGFGGGNGLFGNGNEHYRRPYRPCYRGIYLRIGAATDSVTVFGGGANGAGFLSNQINTTQAENLS